MGFTRKSDLRIRILSTVLMLSATCSAAAAQSELGQNEMENSAKVQYISFLESRPDSELVKYGHLYPEEKIADLERNVSIGAHFKEYKWTTRPDSIDSSKSIIDMCTYDQDGFLMMAGGQARAVVSMREINGSWTFVGLGKPREELVDVIKTHFTDDGTIILLTFGPAQLLEVSKGKTIEYYPANERAASIFKYQKDDQGEYVPLDGEKVLEVWK